MLFKRSCMSMDRASKARKARKATKRSFRDDAAQRMREHSDAQSLEPSPSVGGSSMASPRLNSAIITIAVGKDQRLFAAHEDVLSQSPWFAEARRGQFFDPALKRIALPHDQPAVFSAVLEFLYKADYYPRLLHDRKRNTWALEDGPGALSGAAASVSPRSQTPPGAVNEFAAIYHDGVGDYILRDTVVYCAALRLRLPDLQRLALRKQGLHTGIDVATILRSARFAYANTPPSDSRLRAHYLALVIRSRKTFKRSGTMQMEMEKGGTPMFFDLFVAMCNHMDDVADMGTAQRSPDITT